MSDKDTPMTNDSATAQPSDVGDIVERLDKRLTKPINGSLADWRAAMEAEWAEMKAATRQLSADNAAKDARLEFLSTAYDAAEADVTALQAKVDQLSADNATLREVIYHTDPDEAPVKFKTLILCNAHGDEEGYRTALSNLKAGGTE